MKTTRIVLALALLAVAVPWSAAQDTPPDKRVSVSLRAVPLRDALLILFRGSGLQYAVLAEVGDQPITLNVRDQPIELALRKVLELASVGGSRPITFVREQGIYTILPGSAAAPSPGGNQVPPQGDKRVTLNLRAVPLRAAIEMLFQGTGYQFSVAPDILDIPLTLHIRDQPFEVALRTLLRLANASSPNELLYQSDDGRYRIVTQPRATADRSSSPHFQLLPVNYVRVGAVLDQLNRQTLPPSVALQAIEGTNGLLVYATAEEVERVKTLVRFFDIPLKQLSVEAGVTCTGPTGKPLRFQSQARTMNAQQVVLDDRSGPAGQSAGVKVILRPMINGDGSVLIESDWDLSVPVSGGTKGAVRLVKRLATTTRFMPGQEVTVGEVDATAWGGKGSVRLWLKAEILPDPVEVRPAPRGNVRRPTP